MQQVARHPARFAVYGTLRDDDDTGASWTKQFLQEAKHERIYTAHVHGFKMYMNKVHRWPYALRTNNQDDFIVVRVIEFPPEIHDDKLRQADEIENYEPNPKASPGSAQDHQPECSYDRTVVYPQRIGVTEAKGDESQTSGGPNQPSSFHCTLCSTSNPLMSEEQDQSNGAYLYFVSALDPKHEWEPVKGT